MEAIKVGANPAGAEMNNDGAKSSWHRHVYSTNSVLERDPKLHFFVEFVKFSAPTETSTEASQVGAMFAGAETLS
jgi:hypothetical protein